MSFTASTMSEVLAVTDLPLKISASATEESRFPHWRQILAAVGTPNKYHWSTWAISR